MYMQMGGWCLTTSGAKVLVYMVVLYITCLWNQPCLLNLLHYLIPYFHPHTEPLVITTLSTLSAAIISYTPMVVHTLLIWPMYPISVCKPCPIPLDHLLMEELTVVWLALMSMCLNTLNDMQILHE